jgi:hypothetical protein
MPHMTTTTKTKHPTVRDVDLGCFRVASGSVIAADPAYIGDVDKDYVISFKAKNGLCRTTIEQVATRVVSITARHADHPDADPSVPVKGVVGVDTASAGFFDAKSQLGVICSSGYWRRCVSMLRGTGAWRGGCCAHRLYR